MFYRVPDQITCGSSASYNSSPYDLVATRHYTKSPNTMKVPNNPSAFWYARNITSLNHPLYDKCHIYDAVRGLYFDNVFVPKNIVRKNLLDLKFIGSYLLARSSNNNYILIQANSIEHTLGKQISNHVIPKFKSNEKISNAFLKKAFENNNFLVSRNKYNPDGTNSIYQVVLTRAYKACMVDSTLWISPNAKSDIYFAQDIISKDRYMQEMTDVYCCGTPAVQQFVDHYYKPEYRTLFRQAMSAAPDNMLDAGHIMNVINSTNGYSNPVDYPEQSFVAKNILMKNTLYRLAFYKNNQLYDTVGYFTKNRYYFADVSKLAVEFVDEQQFDLKMRSPKNYAFLREFGNIQLLKFQPVDFAITNHPQILNRISFLG